jgi:hypothetical protein
VTSSGTARARSDAAESSRRAPGGIGRWRLLVLAAIVVAALAVPAVYLATQRPTATGIVVRVDTVSLTDVRSFDLRTADGQVLTFRIGQLDLSPPGFNAQHLVVHQATAQPVIVEYEVEGGERVAVRLLDGPVQSP